MDGGTGPLLRRRKRDQLVQRVAHRAQNLGRPGLAVLRPAHPVLEVQAVEGQARHDYGGGGGQRPEPNGLSPPGGDLPVDPRPQQPGWLARWSRQGDLSHHGEEALQCAPALLAVGKMGRDGLLCFPHLVLVQGVQGVGCEQLRGQVFVHSSRSVRTRWSLRIAARVRVFTVPRGIFSSSAICHCL